MKKQQNPISELISAVAIYRRSSRGHSANFAIALLLLIKRFYDQKELIPGVKISEAFIEGFKEFQENFNRSPEIGLDKICKAIDAHCVMPLSLSHKITELEHSREIDPLVLSRLLNVLLKTDLADKQLRACDENFESLFSNLTSQQEFSKGLSQFEIRFSVVRLMVHLLELRKGDTVYCPYEHSYALTKHLGIRLGENGYLDLNQDLKITVQSLNSHQLDMHQLLLLANGVSGVEFYNSDPLTHPLVKPQEQKIKLSNSTLKEWAEDSKNDRLMQFDRAIALPPLGLKSEGKTATYDRLNRFVYGTPKTKVADLYIIQHILAATNESGKAVILTSKGPLLREAELEIRKAIVNDDVLEAIIQLPANSCRDTAMPLVMLVFNKSKSNKHKGKIAFIDAQRLLNHIHSGVASVKPYKLFKAYENIENLCRIVSHREIEEKSFNLDPRLYVDDSEEANQLRGLMAQHGNYTLKTFSDDKLVLKLNKLKKEEDIIDEQNCIYMPSITSMQPITDIRDRLANNKTPIVRYYQVQLNPKIILAEFAEFFFKTELGRSIFGNLGEGATIPYLNRERLKECRIATPPIQVQKNILETFRKFERLDTLVENYKKDVVLNPESAVTMSNKLDDMIASVTKLSEEDLVLGFIRGGENRHVEFKETFEFNTHINGNRDGRLVDSCIKTIGAFLNSGGGNLLVGVSDDQQVIGIERDIKMNKGTNDGFLLHFKNFIEKRIGQEYYNVIDQKIITVRNKPILWVNCSSAKEAKLGVVFVDNEDCYVRTNPATDKLTGRELETFLRNFSASEA